MRDFFGGFFNKAVSGHSGAGVEEIYPLALKCNHFTKIDIQSTYRKILTDVIERTHGVPEKMEKHLWDNCVVNEAADGLITLLVKAMYNKGQLFLVYVKSADVMRVATPNEQTQIKEDYRSKGASDVGCFIAFSNFEITDILKIFSELEYYVLAGFHKNVNLSKAVQIKMDQMRASVAFSDADVAIQQAKEIAVSLRAGRDVLLDSKDSIDTAKTDMSPIDSAVTFLNTKRSFYLGLPVSYVSGVQTGGIGSTGEGDNRAIERGLKYFYESIVKPVLLALFGLKTEYRSSDFREISSALETLTTFETISDSSLSRESKDKIIAMMFGLDPKEEQNAKAKESALRGSDTSLNGAQVTAMSQFLAQLATGQLAPDTAIQALMVSFNLTRDDAEAIVDPMSNFKPRANT